MLGRLADACRGDRLNTAERLLLAWSVAVTGFFIVSRYRLDHYLYPAAPALCLFAAAAWQRARDASPPSRSTGVWIGSLLAMATVAIAGVLFGIWFERVPVDLPPEARLAAVGLAGGGLLALIQTVVRREPLPRIPIPLLAGLLLLYACTVVEGLPAFERAKPVRELATWVSENMNADDRMASFRMTRWSSSWRFYVNRPSRVLETPEDVWAFFSQAGNGYCLMLEQDYERLRDAGIPLIVVHQQEGLFTTTGRALRRAAGRRSGWRWFLIVTLDQAARE
jgi:4-amino-4-deoxy-L-arabinose transferase-like glycosyltransferase